jgi:hypothetical protein
MMGRPAAAFLSDSEWLALVYQKNHLTIPFTCPHKRLQSEI